MPVPRPGRLAGPAPGCLAGQPPFAACGSRGRITAYGSRRASRFVMIARVTQYRIRAGKVDEFAAKVETLIGAMDNLKGFRVLLVLRGDDPAGRDATAISVWDTVEDLKSSENDTFYYGVLKSLMGCCESFSPPHHQSVLQSKFAKR